MSKSILVVYYLSRKEKMCKEGIDTAIFDCEVRKGLVVLVIMVTVPYHTIFG
jgi:hypothetical protein